MWNLLQEIEKGDDDIVTVDMHDGSLYVAEPKQKVDLTKYTDTHKFVFDDSLDHNVSNDVVYSHTVQPLVHTIFKAGKATCFAYGQTGSGKTYTMSPLPPRAASEILTLLGTTSFSEMGLFVSCFEIYGNKVRWTHELLCTFMCIVQLCFHITLCWLGWTAVATPGLLSKRDMYIQSQIHVP